MIESYEEYLKRINQKDSRTAWKWWKIEKNKKEVFGHTV